MRLVRFEPVTKNHREILNGGLMLSWITGLTADVAAAYTAGTKKRTGLNASLVVAQPARGGGTHLGDRAEGRVITSGAYNLQRELGGHTNPVPERSLFKALRVTGGDVNEGTRPRFAGGAPGRPSVRSFRKGGR